MVDPKAILTERFKAAIAKAWDEATAAVDPLIAASNNAKFGDYQANVAMSLSKRVGMKPHDVAKRIIEFIEISDIAATPTIAGPGFINVKLNDAFIAKCIGEMAADARLGVKTSSGERVVIDYSGPNVAKEMHVGHLRSTIIGDAIARVLEFRGDTVIRQNHMGDWGTQFGMLIEFLVEQKGGASASSNFAISDLNAFYKEAKIRDDSDAAFKEKARHRVVMLQSGDEATLAMWRYLIDESKKHFNAVYRRLNVSLTDADVRAESAYNPFLNDVASELLKSGVAVESQGATCVFFEPPYLNEKGEPTPLLVRKADGGFGYAGTDLAAVRFRVRELNASRMVYVTDSRQKQHFEMVFKTAHRAGWLPAVGASGPRAEHVPFGTVLGEDNKPFKTRSGEVVKLTDLLDEAEERALAVVTAKQSDLDEASRKTISRVIGLGAVKYADLSNDRVKDYVFSWDRMLSFDGNTAPYLVNAYVRNRSIFRKGGIEAAPVGTAVTLVEPAERALALKLLQLSATIESVAVSLEPHRLCTYLYEVASAYHSFFENCPVLSAENEGLKQSRLVLCGVTARVLKQGLGLLGIEVVEKM